MTNQNCIMTHSFLVICNSFDVMQFLRRFSQIRNLSSIKTNVSPSTKQKELSEIQKLMRNYNNSHESIRTLALFEWMINISDTKPDFPCYLQIIRACGKVNHFNFCQRVHDFIENDQTLDQNEYYQLQTKLIYMYAKINRLDLVEQIFHSLTNTNNQIKHTKSMKMNY